MKKPLKCVVSVYTKFETAVVGDLRFAKAISIAGIQHTRRTWFAYELFQRFESNRRIICCLLSYLSSIKPGSLLISQSNLSGMLMGI